MSAEHTKVLIIETPDKMTYHHLELLNKKISEMDGVELLRWTPDYCKLRYNIHLYDKSIILQELEKLGIKYKHFDKENFIKKFLNTIAKENKKSFGNRNLDCCSLNHR